MYIKTVRSNVTTLWHTLFNWGPGTSVTENSDLSRSMGDLFANSDPSVILSFLKAIKVYDKLQTLLAIVNTICFYFNCFYLPCT